MADETLNKLRSDWETLAHQESYWTKGGNTGSGWDQDRFLQVGRDEVDDMLSTLHRISPGQRHEAALDFGCGVGRLTDRLADTFDTVTGIDISDEQIRRASERVQRPGVEFRVNAAADLSMFADASFDLVYAHVVFQHMRPELTRGYLTDAFRVLRPGGALVFTMPSMAKLTPGGVAYTVLPKRAVNALKMRRDGVLMEMNPIPHDELSAHLERAGFNFPLLQPSPSAGPNWWAFRYFALKS